MEHHGFRNHTWAYSIGDERGLMRLDSEKQIASSWYHPKQLEIDLILADGNPHRFAIYFLDWDRNGRSTLVEVINPTSRQSVGLANLLVIFERKISGLVNCWTRENQNHCGERKRIHQRIVFRFRVKNMIRISVVMPVWNGSKYLREAIDSVLNQTLSDFELLVIDDGSSDETLSILHSYKDPRVRIFERQHDGIVSALNYGVAHAKADWIARMDSDDVAFPHRFARQRETLAKSRTAVLCYSTVELFGESAHLVGSYLFASFSRFAGNEILFSISDCSSLGHFQKTSL